jgi:hypothetical protein
MPKKKKDSRSRMKPKPMTKAGIGSLAMKGFDIGGDELEKGGKNIPPMFDGAGQPVSLEHAARAVRAFAQLWGP